jgi:methanogenic corrinoid protein MtbC1
VLACAPGELHEGSLLMLGALLRRRRWPIAYLGQAVPLEDLAGFVCEIRPPVVVTVAMTLETAQALSHWPEFLQNCPDQEKPLFTFGGRAFVKHPELLDDFAGTYLGDSIQEGLETIERLSLAAR